MNYKMGVQLKNNIQDLVLQMLHHSSFWQGIIKLPFIFHL